MTVYLHHIWPYICTIYDRTSGDFPAKITVYTIYGVYIGFWPTLDMCHAWVVLRRFQIGTPKYTPLWLTCRTTLTPTHPHTPSHTLTLKYTPLWLTCRITLTPTHPHTPSRTLTLKYTPLWLTCRITLPGARGGAAWCMAGGRGTDPKHASAAYLCSTHTIKGKHASATYLCSTHTI